MPKMANLASFWNLKRPVKRCYQTSQLGQKLVKITKVKYVKWDISANFQTLRYSVPWVSPRELIHCNVTFIFQICLQMVFAYLQSVLCSGHYRLLHYDGHFSRPTFFLWCQASHLDGHWDLVNVLRIVLWSRGQRCCGILYGKNGCSNRRKYRASQQVWNLFTRFARKLLFFWPLHTTVL